MKITRTGAKADHGGQVMEPELHRFQWLGERLRCESGGIKDFSAKTKHDYKFDLDMSELNEILKMLGSLATRDAASFEAHFGGSLKAITQMQFAAIGATFQTSDPHGNKK